MEDFWEALEQRAKHGLGIEPQMTNTIKGLQKRVQKALARDTTPTGNRRSQGR